MSDTRLYLEEPFASLWSGQDPFSAVERLEGEVFRELEARRTLRTEVNGRSYFVKIHRGVGWGEILKNLICLRRPVLGAENEWAAIRRLEELGVDTMKAVAFGSRGCNPASRHSFIVTEALQPTISLEDYCRDWDQQAVAPAIKFRLIERVARMAGRMHRGGVNHRDFYICHFLLHLDPPPETGALKLSLIDLHRAQVRAKTPRRWRDKDLASLYFSVLGIGLTQRDVFRFLRDYFELPLRTILEKEARLLQDLAQEAARLQGRFERKFSSRGST